MTLALRGRVLLVAENDAAKVSGKAESRVEQGFVLCQKDEEPAPPEVVERGPIEGEHEWKDVV